jgi:hypothetical protein
MKEFSTRRRLGEGLYMHLREIVPTALFRRCMYWWAQRREGLDKLSLNKKTGYGQHGFQRFPRSISLLLLFYLFYAQAL